MWNRVTNRNFLQSARQYGKLSQQQSARKSVIMKRGGHKVVIPIFAGVIGASLKNSGVITRCLQSSSSESPLTKSASTPTVTKPTKINTQSIKRLFELAKPESKRIAGGVGLLFISSMVTMAVPFGIGKVIDIVFQDDQGVQKLKEVSLFIGGAFLMGALANFGRIYLINTAANNIVGRVRQTVFRSIMKQETAFFDSNKSGELVNRLSSDSQLIGSVLTTNISDGLRSTAQAIAGFGMMSYMSPTLTGVVLSVVPVVGGLALVYGRFVKRLSRKVQDALAQSTQFGSERISNIRTVRAFAKESVETEKYSLKIQEVQNIQQKETLARSLFFGSTGLTGNTIMLAVLWYGSNMLTAGTITVGNLTSFLIYTAYAGMSVVGMSSFYTELMKGMGVSGRLFDLMDREPHISHHRGLKIENFRGEFEFKNCSFNYETRADEVLNNFNLHVPNGSIIGLVGKSGCGKSTIASLLFRFYDIDKGTLKLDDVDIKDLDPMWLRTHIGIVPQDPVLFSGTIAENILYGLPGATEKEMIDAAKKANAHDFIISFQDGYQTMVGERGTSLSGGQRQRVAIARALLKDPKILILDEATSALDSTSEKLVQDALDNYLLVNRTVIIITHRLAMLKKVDTIALIHDGKVVEKGTFDELNSYDSRFRLLLGSEFKS